MCLFVYLFIYLFYCRIDITLAKINPIQIYDVQDFQVHEHIQFCP